MGRAIDMQKDIDDIKIGTRNIKQYSQRYG